MELPTVLLSYGNGFAGTNYYMTLHFQLGPITLGSAEDKENARKEAIEILEKLGIPIDISEKKFRHDGSM